jgi:hypothetical protein
MDNIDAEFSGFVKKIQDNFINHSKQTFCTVIENNVSTESWFDLEQDCHKMMKALSNIEVFPKRIHLVKKGWLVKTSSGKVGRKENKNKIKLERSVSNE